MEPGFCTFFSFIFFSLKMILIHFNLLGPVSHKSWKGSDIIDLGLIFFTQQNPAILTGCVDFLYPLYIISPYKLLHKTTFKSLWLPIMITYYVWHLGCRYTPGAQRPS